ncbi:MAG: phosphoglycerate kinase [Bdellovibrionales bacterium]|nr:phosphoglycerate kinase [Bdellovibrionales bacterium]
MPSKTLEGIKSIENFPLEDKRLFLRLDLNVPLNEAGEITDDTRVQAALPTIRYAIDKGAKIVLASHLGRPKGPQDRDKYSLEPVAKYLTGLLGKEIILVEESRSHAPKALLAGLKPSQIIMLENLRFDPGEEKNDRDFAQWIAEFTDIYINDAFGASHRAHASIVALPELMEKRGLGFLMRKEIEMLDRVRLNPEHPFITVLGGAKVSDKIEVIEVLMDRVDSLIIGGAMAYTFLASQNIAVGKSLVEKDRIRFAGELIDRAKARGKRLLLPIDHRITKDIKDTASLKVTDTAAIPDGWMGVDIGPKTEAAYAAELKRGKTIFWNGPMGVFETPEFAQGTFAVARAITETSAITVVGGGDSASAAQASGLADKFSHISTGGGASLEFLQGDKLPGVEAVRAPKRSEAVVEE